MGRMQTFVQAQKALEVNITDGQRVKLRMTLQTANPRTKYAAFQPSEEGRRATMSRDERYGRGRS